MSGQGKTQHMEVEMAKIHLTRCADYNGHKGHLFAMRGDDDRLNDGNYTSIGTLIRVKGDKVRDHRGTGLIFSSPETGKTYVRWSDWSAGEIV